MLNLFCFLVMISPREGEWEVLWFIVLFYFCFFCLWKISNFCSSFELFVCQWVTYQYMNCLFIVYKYVCKTKTLTIILNYHHSAFENKAKSWKKYFLWRVSVITKTRQNEAKIFKKSHWKVYAFAVSQNITY